jgi:hypothetical protein
MEKNMSNEKDKIKEISPRNPMDSMVMALSPAQLRVLTNLKNGLSLSAGLHGQSEHGGLHMTVFALFRKGIFTKDWNLTPMGKNVVEAIEL